MAFSAVVWAFKDIVTSSKLAQMVENTRTHDHRADGSQGAPKSLPDAGGRFTGTTDATGNLVIPHGLGVVPTRALLTVSTGGTLYLPAQYLPGNTTTNIALVVFTASGARANAVSVTVDWVAWK